MPLNCSACVLEKRGIRTKEPVPHTCYKGDKNYKQPEFKFYSKDEKYFRLNVHCLMFVTTKASKYHVFRNQIVNGTKVSPGCEIWLPNHLHFYDDGVPSDKKVWIKEEHYKTLAFAQKP